VGSGNPESAISRRLGTLISEADRVDAAVYAAVAATPTPHLDRGMQRLSELANYSRLSIGSAALLALFAGPRGRRAAASGLSSVAVTSLVVNLGVKPAARRRRPDRTGQDVPASRHVEMPGSRSFPSGHTAAAVAFASGVARVLPSAGLPLRCLAALVGYSRVHTGVHYPGDVVAGAVMGGVLADLTAGVMARRDGASA
jgi:undecaprenyl-diphosphatase